MSKELQILLDEIQATTRLPLGEIAKRIGYSRPYLNKAKMDGGTRKLIDVIKQEFAETLQNSTVGKKGARSGTMKVVRKDDGKLMASPLPAGSAIVTLQDYIDSLKEQKAIVDRQIVFLQKVVESNLNEVLSIQRITLAHVKTGLQWDAKKLGQGDQAKEEKILMELNTLTGSNLRIISQTDKTISTDIHGNPGS